MMIIPAARFAPKKIVPAPTVSRAFRPAFPSAEHLSPNHLAPSVHATAEVRNTTRPINSTDCASVFSSLSLSRRFDGGTYLPGGHVVQPGEPLLTDPAHELEPLRS